MEKIFPLKLDENLYELLTKAAFATKKSKQQYCLDIITKEAFKDSQNVIIKKESE